MNGLKNIVSPDDAVLNIKSGDRVVIGHAAGEPTTLVEALVRNSNRLSDVEIVHMVSLGEAKYCQPEYAKNFKFNGLFLSAPTRASVHCKQSDFTPCFFSEVPKLWETTLPVDVALVSVAPPDEEGYCSLGVSVDYTFSAAKNAKIVIAEVNSSMPYTHGNCKLHVDEIDFFVTSKKDLLELQPPKITEIEAKIGEYCATLINDGDTLQLGIGAIPDAVLMFLKDKKELGIHSEMFSDGVVDLIQRGVITNNKKNINKGLSVATFLMGTKKLYDYVNQNNTIFMAPVDYVNDPRVICQHDNLVSLNSCIEVDLMGQVNAEMVRGKQISGIGGQVDFVRGATMSIGGKSIIAMPSSVKGELSKIVPRIAEGTVVTTSRCDVDYIVTEYGIAHLKGKTLKQRAESLINIAHPNFREELKVSYNSMFNAV